jgi:hypothetical protein
MVVEATTTTSWNVQIVVAISTTTKWNDLVA